MWAVNAILNGNLYTGFISDWRRRYLTASALSKLDDLRTSKTKETSSMR